MRTALTRRTSAIALAGMLALAGAACEGEGGPTDGGVIEDDGGIVDEQTTTDTGATETDDTDVTDEGTAPGATETAS